MPELDDIMFRKVHPPKGWLVPSMEMQIWDVADCNGTTLARVSLTPSEPAWLARVESFESSTSASALTKWVARLLAWEVGCTAEMVQLTLKGAPGEVIPLIRTGSEYV